MFYNLNNKKLSLDIQGEKSFGEDKVLLAEEDDLTIGTSWREQGYIIEEFLNVNDFGIMVSGLEEIFIKAVKDSFGYLPDNFRSEEYHALNKDNQQLHLDIINKTTQLSYNYFPIEITKVVDRISEILNIPLTVTNPFNQYERFHLRTVRPGHQDFNPLHRDSWLDRLKNGINLYVPICGSNEKSSLCVIPKSHYWKESEVERTSGGALVNGVKYSVPALTNTTHPLDIVRPNPGYNQVLVFSPYLLHGGAANFNENETRISLEMRLWRKN